MSKRILIYFTKGRDSKSSYNYLENLQDDDSLNFELVLIQCVNDNPIASKYNIKQTPTFVLTEKVENKELYKEIKRLVGKVSKEKLLEFVRGE